MSVPQIMVANCPRCGKVFQRNLRNQCSACSTSMNDLLTSVLEILRRNYRLTNEQVCEATGVSHLQLQVWMKDYKLHLADYPNLNYPCGSCAAPIRERKLCVACSTRITREVRKLSESATTPVPAKQPEGKPQRSSGGLQIGDRWNRV